jgi:hypothetical protein
MKRRSIMFTVYLGDVEDPFTGALRFKPIIPNKRRRLARPAVCVYSRRLFAVSEVHG